MRTVALHIAALLILSGCATYGPAPVTKVLSPQTDLSFERMKERWTVSFDMPNPIFAKIGAEQTPSGRLITGRIGVRAALYSDELLRSLMKDMCRGRTEEECRAGREAYRREHNPDGELRIEVVMSSDFSKLSLDPDIWTVYITDQDGIMYEPSRVVADSIASETRMIYSRFHDMTFRKEKLKRTLNFYFPRITFFGKELMGEGGFSLTLSFSYRGEVLGSAKWVFKL